MFRFTLIALAMVFISMIVLTQAEGEFDEEEADPTTTITPLY